MLCLNIFIILLLFFINFNSNFNEYYSILFFRVKLLKFLNLFQIYLKILQIKFNFFIEYII